MNEEEGVGNGKENREQQPDDEHDRQSVTGSASKSKIGSATKKGSASKSKPRKRARR